MESIQLSFTMHTKAIRLDRINCHSKEEPMEMMLGLECIENFVKN